MYTSRSQIREIIEKYKQTLRHLGVEVERVILFGSYAKEQQREDSDIDIIIISESFQKMNLRERLEILGIAAARTMKPIEARGYTPQEIKTPRDASFLKEILKVGITLH